MSSLATEFIPWRPGKTVWLLVLLLISLTVAKPAGADRVNLPLQGFVIDSETERPLSRTMQVTFTVYSDCDADESFWSVTKFVEFIGGYYSVGLDIPDNVFSLSDDLCLGIQIGDDEELTPRLEFFSTPFAKRSNRADSAELADLAETALNLASDNLPNLAGSGLTTSGDALSLDTSDSQIWTGTQTYSAQVIVSRVPQDGFSSSASLRVNPVITTSDAANRKFFAIQDNGTDRFTVDKEGDVTIAGNLTVTGTATIGSLGDITSVTAGSGLSGGGLTGALSLSIAPGGVTSAMIADETLTTNDVQDETLTTSDLAATLTFAAGDLLDLGAATDKNKGLRVPQGTATSPTNPDAVEGLLYWDTDDNFLRIYNGSSWQEVGGEFSLGSTIESSEVADGTLVNADISATAAIVYSKLNLSASVVSGDIVDGTLTAADIGTDAVASAEIATGAVGTAEIADNVITTTDIAATLTFADADFVDLSAILHNDSVQQGFRLPNVGSSPTDIAGTTEGYIAWNQTDDQFLINDGSTWVNLGNPFGSSIDSSEITNGTIVAADITGGTITTTEIALDTILAADIAANAVGSSEIEDGAVSSTDIALDTIVAADIAPDAIGDSELDTTVAYTFTGNEIFQPAAGGKVFIDGAATDNTGTAGVLDLDVDAGNAAVDGINIDLEAAGAIAAGTDITALEIVLTATDTDADLFGIALSTHATAGIADSYEAALKIDNTDDTPGSMPDAILITSSGVNTGITDAVDASADNITNALNAGANNLTATNWSITGASGNFDTAGTIQAGSGNETITLSTGKLDADAMTLITGDGVGGTSSGSGLETDTDRLGFLQGCADGEILKWIDGTSTWGCAADAGAGASPFATAVGVITKNTASDALSLRYGDAADIQLQIENTTTGTIPAADAMTIDLSGNTTGIVTDGADGLYIIAEFGNGTANTNSALHLDVDPVNTPSGDETFYALNIDSLAAGTAAVETAINIGANWDNAINVAGTLVTPAELAILAGNINGGAGGDITDNTIATNDLLDGTITGDDANSNIAGTGLLKDTVATPDEIDIDLLDSADGTGGTSSNSGLEFQGTSSDELTLLQGCANEDVLRWNDSAGTWGCAAIAPPTETAIDSVAIGDLPNGVGNIVEVMNSAEPTITPATATNRIWVTGTITLEGDSTDDETSTFNVWRDTEDDANCDGTQVGVDLTQFATLTALDQFSISFSFIDSPSSTSAQYYSVCGYTNTLTTPNGVSLVTITIQEIPATGADLAELYSTTDPTINAGTVVRLDPTLEAGVKKSSHPYDRQLIGVISSDPGLLMDDGRALSGGIVPVALAGRVPVKVTTHGGEEPIVAGDYLTSSELPGVAMKATRPGQVIGKALSGLGQGDGYVLVFLEAGYQTPEEDNPELRQIIDEQQKTIEDQEGRIEEMERRLKAIENLIMISP